MFYENNKKAYADEVRDRIRKKNLEEKDKSSENQSDASTVEESKSNI